jgi:hypothetical protein
VCLWETATGQERHRFQGHDAEVVSLAFTRDGRALASGGKDTMAMLWDTIGFTKEERAQWPRPTPRELEILWADLRGADAVKAFRAIGTLTAASGPTVSFVQKRLPPVAAPDGKRFARLLAELDNPQFSVREKANAELEKLGAAAEPLLREALAGRLSLEAQRRVERLLEKVQGLVLTPDELRAWRAVEVLEHIGSPEARQLLEALAKGQQEAPLTREAQAALRRLTVRATGTP